MKKPVLHYRGYAYLKARVNKKNQQEWVCRFRLKNSKRCPGYIYTSEGQVVGEGREHNHLPPDVKPQVTEDGNRMLTPLFL